MSADFTANVGANNFSYVAPTNVTASCAIGNALLVAVGVPIASDPITVTDPDNAGNVFAAATGQPFQDTANGWELVVFWLPKAVATLTRFKVTEGGGGNDFCAAWGEIANENVTTFIDAQHGGAGSNTAWTSDPVTSTVAGDLIVGVASESSANALGNSGGFTNVATLSTTRTIYLAKLVNQAIGTYNPNWTGGGVGGTSFSAAIESAAGGGAVDEDGDWVNFQAAA